MKTTGVWISATRRTPKPINSICRGGFFGKSELDPISLSINLQVGAVHYYAGKYDQAIQQFNKALELDSSSPGAHAHLGMAFEQAGRYGEAIPEFRKAAPLSGEHLEYKVAHTY